MRGDWESIFFVHLSPALPPLIPFDLRRDSGGILDASRSDLDAFEASCLMCLGKYNKTVFQLVFTRKSALSKYLLFDFSVYKP